MRGLTPRLVFENGPVTAVLLVANVLVFVVMVVFGVHVLDPESSDLIVFGANFGPRNLDGEPWRLLTAIFVHIGIVHLFFNSYVLLYTGLFVERLVGRTTFATLYLVSGVLGSLASVAWNPVVVSAGASGAIFGLYGAVLAILVLHRDRIPMEALRGLQNSTLTFLGYNLVFGLAVEGIDMAAHLGGLVGGFLCGLAMCRRYTHRLAPIRRAVGVAAAAVGLVVAAFAWLPKDVVEYQRAIDEVSRVESAMIDRFTSAIEAARRREISDGEVAAELTRIVAEWRAARERFEALDLDLPPHLVAQRKRLVSYMRSREEAWELVVQGLLTGDSEMIERGLKQQNQSAKAFPESG